MSQVLIKIRIAGILHLLKEKNDSIYLSLFSAKPNDSGASASGQSSSSGASAAPQFPEADIQKIISRGFSRQQAMAELRHSSGDVNKALIALISKSLAKATKK
jgi:hypothetical protein